MPFRRGSQELQTKDSVRNLGVFKKLCVFVIYQLLHITYLSIITYHKTYGLNNKHFLSHRFCEPDIQEQLVLFWVKVFSEIVVMMLARVVIIQRFDWGWRSHYQDDSLTRLLRRSLSFSLTAGKSPQFLTMWDSHNVV